MSKKRFVTTGEIAKICEVSPKTVIAWIERKQLRSFRIGRGPRKVTLADLYDFLDPVISRSPRSKNSRACWRIRPAANSSRRLRSQYRRLSSRSVG